MIKKYTRGWLTIANKISDLEIIQAVLSSETQKQAAERLHITQATLSRRLKNPKLKAELSKYRLGLIDKTSTELIKSNIIATEKLVELLNSDSELTRYNASTKILQLSRDYVLMSDIATRLEALEKNNRF